MLSNNPPDCSRATSAANNMTTANPTGYFGNGEVEDYRVIVNGVPLEVSILDFAANKIVNEKVSLKWKVADEEMGTMYELQRSNDANSWTTIFTKTVLTSAAVNQYEFIDDYAGKLISYFRNLWENHLLENCSCPNQHPSFY